MPTATLNRPLRILFLGMLLAAPAVRADSYTDFQDASARLEAMVAKATPQSGLPRLGDPGVAALFAQAADGPRLFQAPVVALQDMNQSVAVCERATNLGKAYYTFGLQRPLLLSGAELQQARREQVTQNLTNYGDEMAALFAFGVHCHAHLIGLMETEFRAQPAQDHARILLLEELHQQAVEANHAHVRVRGGRFAGDVHPLVQREDWPLAVAAGNGDDDTVEQFSRTPHEVFVPAGEGVEGPRVDRHRLLHAWLLRIR